MKTIILHIGSGKAGSTSIQAALLEYARTHKKCDFSYPQIERGGNQTFRFAFCSPEEATINIRKRFSGPAGLNDFIGYQKMIKRAIRREALKHTKMILSSEFLFLSTKKEIAKIKKFLENIGFEKFGIVAYVRDPADYYLSVAQQALKNRSKMPLPNNFNYDFISSIDRWSEIFDSSLVVVREFNTERLKGNDIITDFSDSIKSFDMDCNLPFVKPENQSMSAEFTQASQDYYSLFPECNYSHIKAAIEKNTDILHSGSRPKLKPMVRSFIYNDRRDQLDEAACRFGIFNNVNTRDCQPVVLGDVVNFRDIVSDFNESNYNSARDVLLPR